MAVGILALSGLQGAPTHFLMICETLANRSWLLTGPEFWTQTVAETLGRLPLISGITLQSMMMLFVSLAFAFAHLPLWSASSSFCLHSSG
jgi:hypothetical protein